MSKRVRGTRRSGGPRPAARPARRDPPVSVRPLGGTAEALLPNVLAGDVPAANRPVEPRAPAAAPRSGPSRPSVLAARAATEYVYVGQDLRHIAIMAVAIAIILAILFVLIDVARVIQL